MNEGLSHGFMSRHFPNLRAENLDVNLHLCASGAILFLVPGNRSSLKFEVFRDLWMLRATQAQNIKMVVYLVADAWQFRSTLP
ncbi:hypothetical protein llap_10228 [Limosa lapponica baueri]|uniref:Uncharacterized protein n=1 Tax=Limosa lapponica baueri TaxID=1758121 RepID=A0A2I0U0B3_LIMLA|nr:hypothetical protein llap_10228 [Limosa lapponica baueri]